METLIERDKTKTGSNIRKFSILFIVVPLYIVDRYFVRKDGDYIIIADTALTIGDLVLLFFMSLAIIALMRPMEQKKFQRQV